MNKESNSNSLNNISNLFDEALEIEETTISPSPKGSLWPNELTADTSVISDDPTFFDEQVINVPIIDPPDMKSISSYPDTQIYDQLFPTEDDFLLEEEPAEDVITPDTEDTVILEMTELEPTIDEADLSLPDQAPTQETFAEPEWMISGKRPSKKPRVKRAGMPKEEVSVELPAAEEETAKEPSIELMDITPADTSERKTNKKSRAFSTLEKMKKKIADKWV